MLEASCPGEDITSLSDWLVPTNSTSPWYVPNIHECIQHSVLTYLPVIFLAVSSPILLRSLHKSENARTENCSPISLKILICSILCLDTVSLFVYTLYRNVTDQGSSTYDVVSSGALYASLALALVLLVACRNRGVVTSGVLSVYWLLLSLCGLPEFRSKFQVVRGHEEMQDPIRFHLFMLYYPLVLIEFFLSCFADIPRYRVHDSQECPELNTSFLNQITFHWFTGLAITGNKRPLEKEDLWSLNSRDQSSKIVPEFNKHWQENYRSFHAKRGEKKSADEETLVEKSKQQSSKDDHPSVLYPLFKTYKLTFLASALFKLIFDLMQFISPQLLSLLIKFIEDKSQPMWYGVGLACLMFVCALIQSLILHQYFHNMFRLGMNIRSVLTSAVYAKALNLSNNARKNRTVGEIVNLMSVDIQRFQDMTNFIMLFWSAPLQVILAIVFLTHLLGWAVIAGLVVLIAMVPVNSYISVKIRNCQVEQMKFKDERLKMMSEMLNGIKVLKFYAWEESMQKMILNIRKKEIAVLKKLAYLNAVTSLTWTCAPFLVAVLTFGVYVTIDPENNVLTPEITFVALSLFNILRFPLAILAMIISQAIQCAVSNKRLKSFLDEEEMDVLAVEHSHCTDDIVSIKNGNFIWDLARDSPFALADINFTVSKGSLVAIVGGVGSGKSSLLNAFLGEMNKLSGTVCVNGSIAYVPQQAWIQNLALKANILFNHSFDPEKYERTLKVCELQPDLETLPAGDATEIGEKGINLSGGQKQRVSLARAVYAESEIYLLDDPLSAVDAHVGKHLFQNVISSETGILKNKTRILVTHGLNYLKKCDKIVVLREGRISETGTYDELMASEGAFSEFLEEYLIEEAKNRGRSVSFGDQEEEVSEVLAELERLAPERKRRVESQISQVHYSSDESLEKSGERPALCTQKSVSAAQDLLSNGVNSETKEIDALLPPKDEKNSPQAPSKSKLIEKESVETGKVKWFVYATYIRAIGYLVSFSFFFIYAVSSILGVLSNLWLAHWSDDAKRIQSEPEGTYETNSRLGIYTCLGMGQAIFVTVASITMALGMLRASRTLHEGILKNILRSPMSFFDVTPLGRILNRFGKDVDVLDTSLPRSLTSFIRTALSSVEIIMVIIWTTPTFAAAIVPLLIIYTAVLRFYVSTSRQLKRLESTTRSPIYSHFQETIQGVVSIRAYKCMDRFVAESQRKVDDNLVTYYPSIVANRWLAVRLELVGNMIVLCSALFAALYRDSTGVTAGLVGLSVSYALNITQTLNWAVRMTSELETNIVAVERIQEYSDSPTEASLYSENSTSPGKTWPSEGAIEIQNLRIRYREGLEQVLKGVSVSIKPSEKIGIVGRTGAGKSSLTLALFRIVEPDEGRILIDNVDIAAIGLHELRSKLTIVPQDPVLFSGTLRMNLDPFEQYSDADLWRALKLAHLEAFVDSLSDRLEHKISEGGENLSVGQRQLICLARAVLHKTRILVLDEAAAAVDMETDSLIQKTIREQFSECTVLTIAHRLNTVIDNDRLLVLDRGEVPLMKDILLLTANVGSLFDHTGRIHKSWSESIVQTIRREDARFVAVHMQEVGGKNYQECSEQVQPLIEKLYSELSDYTAALAILDLDFDLNDQYTALGSIFLVHNSALSLVEQYNFHVKKYQHLQDPHLNVFREHLSECPFLVKTKFPKHFWPAIKWGRKGYMHTRWRFNNIPLDLINVHLFHDESNLALIHENPSLYSNNRKRALNYVLDQLKTFSNGEKPNAVFIFGDLNFRLDSPSFLNRLTGNGQTDAHHQLEDPHGSVSGNRLTNSRYHLNGSDHASDENSGNADPLRRTVSAIEFRSSGNNESIMTGDAQQNCVLRIEKKLFDYFNHKKLLRDWRGYLEDDKEVHDFPSLKEIEINFPPTYPWSEDPDESEVLMKTRAPAWCDRVLMNDQAHRLVFGANSVLYDSIGKDTCMGDHKPVFLSFSVS